VSIELMLLNARSKVLSLAIMVLAILWPCGVRAEKEILDLQALAKKARPAVMLLVVSDSKGNEIATGTGFLISSDGKLITNCHVVRDAASAVAKAENGGIFSVKGILAADPKRDLVILQLQGKEFPCLALSSSAMVEAGTRIAVIGSPLGLEGTISDGIVSAARDLPDQGTLLQVTAAISPGSSGSPVLNSKGEVIGVIVSTQPGGQALNFAVPVAAARNLATKTQTDKPIQPLNNAFPAEIDRIFTDQHYQAFWAAWATENYVEALQHAKELVRLYPDSSEAFMTLGESYVGLKFNDDAINALRQAIKLKPDYAAVWASLGGAYRNSGRAADAIAAYKQAIKLKPDMAAVWASLGFAYDESGKTADAIAAYRQAIKLDPASDLATETWYNLSCAYAHSGQIDDVIAACRQAIKLDPRYCGAWNNLAVAYAKKGEMKQAWYAVKQVESLDPSRAASLRAALSAK
jgi:tetratricopeptide (TPR) repeat protein